MDIGYGHCMEIDYGYLVWKLCGKIVYGSYAWKSCMETLHGNFVWKSCVEIMYGNHVWKYVMEVLHGHFVWKSCMEVLYGNCVWKPEAKAGNHFCDTQGNWNFQRLGEPAQGGNWGNRWELALAIPGLKLFCKNPLGKPS